jgi:hypothetical protein
VRNCPPCKRARKDPRTISVHNGSSRPTATQGGQRNWSQPPPSSSIDLRRAAPGSRVMTRSPAMPRRCTAACQANITPCLCVTRRLCVRLRIAATWNCAGYALRRGPRYSRWQRLCPSDRLTHGGQAAHRPHALRRTHAQRAEGKRRFYSATSPAEPAAPRSPTYASADHSPARR